MIFFKFVKAWLLPTCLCLCLIIASYATPDDDPTTNIPNDVRELLDLAEDMRCTAHYEKAIQYLEKAQELYLKKGDELAALELYAKILWMPLDVEYDDRLFTKQCTKSVPKLQAKIKQYPQFEAILLLANLQKNWIDEDVKNGLATYKQLEAVFKNYPNWEYQAAAATYLSCIYHIEVDYINSHIFATLAKELIQKNCNPTQEKEAYLYRLYPYYDYYIDCNLAYSKLLDEDNKLTPLDLFNPVLDKLKKGKKMDSLHYANVLSRIGIYYCDAGDGGKAVEFLENSLVYIPKNLNTAVANCYHYIGYCSHGQNSDDYYFKSIQELDKEKKPNPYTLNLYAENYRSLATSHAINDSKNAKLYLEKIAKLPKGSDALPSWTFATWGFIYEFEKEYDKAIEAHEKSIIAYREEGIPPVSAYWNLGNIAAAKKDYKLSVEYFHKGLIEYAENLGADFKLNPQLEDITDKYGASSSIEGKLENYYKHIAINNLWNEHGTQLLELANLIIACFEYNKNQLESENSKEYLLKRAYSTHELVITIYLDYYEQTKEEKYLHKALEFAEKSKSILLEDALKEVNASSFGGIPDSLIKQENDLKQELVLCEKELHLAKKEKIEAAISIAKKALFETRQKADQLKYIFEKNYPKYYDLKYAQTAIAINKVQQALPEKTSILEYFQGYDNVFVFGITNKKINYIKIPIEKGYTASFERLRNALGNTADALKNPMAAFDLFINSSFDFYDTYIQKIIPKETARLIIIPDGLFNYIAFEAMISSKPEYSEKQRADYKNLAYLNNQYTISYNYSAMMWLEQFLSPSKSNNNELLALAAVYGKAFQNKNSATKMQQLRNSLTPIPGTIEEITSLEKIYGGAFYTNEKANEHLFKKEASNYGILHLAMHGISDSEHPEFSSMAFTEDGQNVEDNFLHINEIKQLNLNANLVVLSACQTGFGKYQHGEGVVSLGRSFMYAGAPSVVMTLWNINDHSSVYIVQLFYQNLQQGMDKDKALQKAKQDYINSAPSPANHPAFWAAFVQLGDYKPISIASKSAFSGWMVWAMVGLGLVVIAGLYGVFQSKKKALV